MSYQNTLSPLSDFMLAQVGLQKGPTSFVSIWNHCVSYEFIPAKIYSLTTYEYFGTPNTRKKPTYLPAEVSDMTTIELIFPEFPQKAFQYLNQEYRIDYAQVRTYGVGSHLHVYGRKKNKDGYWGIGRRNILIMHLDDDLELLDR